MNYPDRPFLFCGKSESVIGLSDFGLEFLTSTGIMIDCWNIVDFPKTFQWEFTAMRLNPTDLYETLSFLVGPAGIGAWMLFISDYIRNRTLKGKYDTWTPFQLQAYTAGLSFGVPILAYVLFSIIPQNLYEVLQPHYGFAATCFIAYVTQQGYFWVKGNFGAKSG